MSPVRISKPMVFHIEKEAKPSPHQHFTVVYVIVLITVAVSKPFHLCYLQTVQIESCLPVCRRLLFPLLHTKEIVDVCTQARKL